jgi:hypothetical protein
MSALLKGWKIRVEISRDWARQFIGVNWRVSVGLGPNRRSDELGRLYRNRIY